LFAEFVAALHRLLLPPQKVNFIEAAALPLVGASVPELLDHSGFSRVMIFTRRRSP
jgi:hypothetical protein